LALVVRIIVDRHRLVKMVSIHDDSGPGFAVPFVGI
jgi:hypothetical protein